MVFRPFEERRSEGDSADRAPTFEETYPRYEFAELVRLAMALGAWLGGVRRRVNWGRLEASGNAALEEISPAE